MATVQRRSPVGMFGRKASQFLALRFEETQVKNRKEVLKKEISDIVDKFGEVDEVTGHITLTLPEPVEVGGKVFRTMQRQRRAPKHFDEEIATEILKKHEGALDRVVKPVTTEFFDQDEVYALHQEGVLSEEEIDAMLVEDVSYALVPLAE